MSIWKDKVAVITGGNSGIGLTTAQEFKLLGARVVITGRRKEAVESAAVSLGVDHYHSDQSKLSDIDALAKDVAGKFGKVDVLVVNAGVATFQPIADTPETAFDTMMDINFKGAFFTLQKFIPLLADGASVVLISSNTASMSRPGTSVYTASKAALNAFMRIAAVELALRKIRVNAISPGPTETEMVHKFGFDEQTLKGMKAAIIQEVPLAKIGAARDVARMAVYLSNDETSSFITGAEFFIDGGMILK